MRRVTKVLVLLLAVAVPVTAYVAGSLVAPGSPAPADHSPVILRDLPAEAPATDAPADPTTPPDGQSTTPGPDPDEARVVTPQPTPVGEDDDDADDADDGDDGDDDGPDDDDTDERDDGDD